MSCKICYKTEIHRLTKLPQDFNALLKVIQEVFTSNLPGKFTLEYQDAEGDRIIIHNDEDYKLALESEKSLKIFLNDASDMDNVSFITRASIDDTLQLQEQQQHKVPEPPVKSFEILAETQEVPVAVVEEKAVLIEEEQLLAEEEKPLLAEEENEAEEQDLHVEEMLPSVQAKQLMIEIPTSRSQLMTDPNEVPLESGVTVISVQKGKGKKFNQKTEAMQQIAHETLINELPDIFMVVQEMINESLAEVKDCKKKNYNRRQRKLARATHSRIGCDVCGTFPIIGTRYKCTVLSDYDLCEECESMNEHPYPLIKIADESQYKHIRALLAEEPFCYETKKHYKNGGCKRSRKEKKEASNNDNFESVIDNLLQDFAGVTTKDPKCFVEMAEELVSNFKDTLKDCKIEELLTQPEKETQPQQQQQQQQPNVQENNNDKPATSVEEVVGGIVQQLTGGAAESVEFLANMANTFAGNWGGLLGGLVQNFAASQKVEPQVTEEPKVEKPVVIEDETIVAEKKEEEKKYPTEVTKKAEAFVEIFPQANFDDICEYISNAPNKSIEDLVLDYMMGF